MKSSQKKVMRAFRIDAGINENLKRNSKAVKQSETRLVEDALECYFTNFADNVKRTLARKLKGMRGGGFEPPTPTVSRWGIPAAA